MRDLQTIVNDFVKNLDLVETDILEAVSHLIEVEIIERQMRDNPHMFGEDQ